MDQTIAVELTIGLQGNLAALARVVDAGLRLSDRDEVSASTCFNLALAAQRLGMRTMAEDRWSACARQEGSEGWRREIVARIASLPVPEEDHDPYRAQYRLLSGDGADPGQALDVLCASFAGSEQRASGDERDAWSRDLCRQVAEDRSGLLRRLEAFSQGMDAYDRRDYATAAEQFAAAAKGASVMDDPLRLQALAHRGAALFGLGEHDDRALRAVLDRAEARGYGWAAGLARWTLGRSAVSREAWLDAADLFERAHHAFASSGAVGPAASVGVLASEVYGVIGEESRSWDWASQALAAAHGNADERPIFFVNSILSDVASRQGLIRIALELQEEALRRGKGEHPRVLAYCELWKAHLLEMLGSQQEARMAMMRAERLAEALPENRERERLEAEIAFGQAAVADDADRLPALDRAIGLLSSQRRIALLLLALHRHARIARDEGEENRALADLEQALRIELGFAGSLRSDEAVRLSFVGTQQSAADELIELQIELDRPWQAFSTAQRVLSAAAPGDIGSLSAPEEISQRLQTTRVGAVVVLSQMDDLAAAWIVTKEARHFTTWRQSRRQVREAIELYWGAADRAESERAAATLHELVVRPWRDRVDAVDEIVLVPDQELARVPFAGLYDQRRNEYLIESVVIGFGSVVRSPEPSTRQPVLAHVVVFAPGASAATDALGLPSLSGAAAEARAIAASFPGSELVTGAGATRDALLRKLPRASIFHFAGHGLPNARGGDAALVVSSDEPEGMLVTASDLAALRLADVRLIALSGCSTARSRNSSWQAGWSLARAALAAGAPAVLTTIADVEDNQARSLMVDFYSEIGAGPVWALAKAQRRAILRQESDNSGPRPTWPAFVLLTR